MTDTTAQVIWGVLALVLVGSSLIARKLPIGQTVKMALTWVAIFVGMFVLFLFRDEGRVIWQRATAELSGGAGQTVGSTLRIKKSDDGHFWARGTINGASVMFLIDSGATTTTLSPKAAAAAQIVASGGFPVIVETANGIVEAQRAQISELKVGPITHRDLAAHIGSDAIGDINLLGMNFLSGLKSWRVEGDILILEPHNI